MKEILKQGKQLIKEGINFRLVNKFEEQKTFAVGTKVYNVQSLKNVVMLEEDNELKIEILN